MLLECTWIIDMEKACSKGGSSIADIQLLAVNAFDNLLAGEEVIWIFFQRVKDCTGLLEVTVESISSGEIGTRYWTGEQRVAAAAKTKSQPSVYSCKRCPLTKL